MKLFKYSAAEEAQNTRQSLETIRAWRRTCSRTEANRGGDDIAGEEFRTKS